MSRALSAATIPVATARTSRTAPSPGLHVTPDAATAAAITRTRAATPALPCRLVRRLDPGEKLGVHFFHVRQLHLVVAHLAGRQLLQALGRLQPLGVDPHLDARVGRGPDHRELLLPAIADVGL